MAFHAGPLNLFIANISLLACEIAKTDAISLKATTFLKDV